jgi:predicted deacylase
MSPWYAFRIWADARKEVSVRLAYHESARHRYDPQISNDGWKWKLLEKNRIIEEGKGAGTSGPESRPKSIVMRLSIGRKPLWVSAQELQNSGAVFEWMNETARRRNLKITEIGRSKEGRPIKMLSVGKPDSKKMMMVISRQHPPEVTGYFAMQSFVETIAGKSDLAKKFRNEWSIYVVPLMNPDGVDGGNWRHNSGGIDLNRDWTVFNQPEDKTVSDFLKRRETETGGKFFFGIDFHSTWDDIYYPMTRRNEGNSPGLVQDWLTNIQASLPGYKPVIQAQDNPLPARVSRNYFLTAHKMEAIVFEIGDNTPRDFIKKKGRVGAEEIMKLLIARTKD